jgi:hypothetical protein
MELKVRTQPVPVTSQIVETAGFTALGHLPAAITKRETGARWLVRDLPIGGVKEGVHEWGTVSTGELVRIPLYPYVCASNDPAVAMGFAVSLGLQAYSIAVEIAKINRSHVAIGFPVEEVMGGPEANTPVFRVWVGFAFVVRS